MRPSTPEMFWARLRHDADWCWRWTGATKLGSHKYGLLNYRGQRKTASRLAWELAHGPIPEGASVLHRCDNPPCCNPDHLFLGTPSANSRDMVAKGRSTAGRNPRARLTAEQVMSMRADHAAGLGASALARRYGVSRGAARYAIERRSWRHIPDHSPAVRRTDPEKRRAPQPSGALLFSVELSGIEPLAS